MIISYQEYGAKPVACPHCASPNVQRKIGRVRIAHSAESRMDHFDDLSGLEGMEDDPRALGRMMRKMSKEMGGEMGEEMEPEMDEVIDRLEAGQSPEDIEAAMPDLGTPGGPDMPASGLDADDF